MTPEIERELREGLEQLKDWPANKRAANFGAIPKFTLGDLRYLLDEIERLRKENAAWAGAATFGDGSPMMTPSKLIKALSRLMTERDTALASRSRGNEDG